MEQKYVLGIFALTMIAILSVGVASAHGFGFWNSDLTEEERAEMQETQDAIQEAIVDGDYETWKSLMEDKIEKMKEDLTEENFDGLVERHKEMEEFRDLMEEAKESGDFSKIEELKKEHGFGPMFEKGPKMGNFGDCKGFSE